MPHWQLLILCQHSNALELPLLGRVLIYTIYQSSSHFGAFVHPRLPDVKKAKIEHESVSCRISKTKTKTKNVKESLFVTTFLTIC
jgi:hypothetical protein